MKTLIRISMAAMALVFASSAVSQTVIRIVASNGDRTATQTAISKLLSTTAGGPLGTGWAFQGINGYIRNASGVISGTSSNLNIATGANFGAWNGRITATGQDVVIKVSYAGALAGIQAIAGNVQQRFVVADGSGTTTPPNPLTATQLGVTYELGTADFGFSTNFQSTSPFNGTFQGVTYNPIVEENVGISPLGFYASPGFPGSPSSSNPSFVPNITTQLAQQLYSGGVISLSQFTGDWDNDKNKLVFAIGRNVDAGQRFGAYLENGIGFNQVVSVWFPTITGQTTTSGITYGGTVGSHVPWPVAQQPGSFPVIAGNGGYNSGANLAVVLTASLGVNAYKVQYFDEDLQENQFLYPDATAGYYIGYLTPGDANPRVLGTTGVVPSGNRGVALTYNGVALTDANVKNGTYTAWLYNRILKPQSLTSGPIFDFANSLRDQIRNVDAPSGGGLIDDATVKVQRFTDGGPVQGK
jgi:hypothetical protein